jgi:hypothetical protein
MPGFEADLPATWDGEVADRGTIARMLSFCRDFSEWIADN